MADATVHRPEDPAETARWERDKLPRRVRTQAERDADDHTWRAAADCHYCGPTDRELRPYGPGGSTVCFPCATATPEREQSAHGVFGALLDATSAVGLAAIGTEEGPINLDPRTLPTTD